MTISDLSTVGYELAPGIERFLAIFQDPEMQTLQDVVDFGRAHAPKELPQGEPPSFMNSTSSCCTESVSLQSIQAKSFLRGGFRTI